ncbi:MAG: aminoglycoside phosphotransferase [Acidimicrobiales bacterium]
MIAPDVLSSVLVEHLPDHLSRQRWSGAQEGDITHLEVEWLDVLQPDEPLLAWALVLARLADGSEHRYQIFVGGRRASEAPEFLEGKDREIVHVVPQEDGDVVLYDALVDPDLAIAILHLVAPEIEVEVRRPIVLEHSNSSVVFDETSILKIFRKVVPGPNPDVEITRVLAGHGYPNVLAPLAELRKGDTDLAVLREFLVGASDGWQLARTSVRDMLASRLPPEDSGGDLAPGMARLGLTIAGLHVAMADAWGSTPGVAGGWIDQMEAYLDSLPGLGVAVETLDFDPDAVRVRFERARALEDTGREIRIHGDLHLAQVIQVDAGWVVLDFEGEPARRRADRFTLSSPLRDVAGILRSLHYAAAAGLAEWDLGDDELAALLVAWEERNRAAFLDSYLGYGGVDGLLPTDPAARAALLAAFELDKAVYELGYELRHRPELASIPLEGIDRLVRGPVPT